MRIQLKMGKRSIQKYLAFTFKFRKNEKLTRLSMCDPVVAHSNRWRVPADCDASWGGVQYFQICWRIRDWRESEKPEIQ